jgi:hypothetical protein
MAGRIGDATGARVTSTDRLGRHPGRPWPQVRPQVDEYYSRLTDETIYWFLRVHHENIWPVIQHKIELGRSFGQYVLEGAALRPELISTFADDAISIVGLYASREFLEHRMETESRYAQADEHGRVLISRFIARSLRDNEQLIEDARRLRLRLVDVASPRNVSSVVEELTATLSLRAPETG